MTFENPNSKDWQKAAITGGIIGACILGGAIVLKGQLSGMEAKTTPIAANAPAVNAPAANAPAANTPTSSATTTPNTAANPTQNAPAPAEPASNEPSAPALTSVGNTNGTIVGQPGSKNIRSNPSTNGNILYRSVPGDRVRILGTTRNADGHLWYRIYLPDGNEGWIASQLVETDRGVDFGATQPQPTTPTPASNTNATIVGASGSKNVRSGPGTSFEVAHVAYPGDRVQIIDSSTDAGGYTWHKVFFPKSGATGWLAAQLIQRD